MAGTNEEYKFLTVKYMLDQREQAALEELLPYFQQYEGNNGSRPFEKWTIENMFQAVMEMGAKFDIAAKIQDMQVREGLISWEEREKEGFKTMEERKKEQ